MKFEIYYVVYDGSARHELTAATFEAETQEQADERLWLTNEAARIQYEMRQRPSLLPRTHYQLRQIN